MPDTPDNQAAYPQHTAQAPGIGFPIARLVVVFSLACGTAVDAALGRYQGKRSGETALLRGLDAALEPGDVLLGDRYYGGWFDLVLRHERGVDVVVRLHQKRHCDFRRGRRLGPDDHLVEWAKPPRPDWMDAATYAGLPDRLVVREVRVRVAQNGFRTRCVVVVTTLVDAVAVTATDLAELYRARWHAELDLRSLKVTLGMDVLRCKTPAMVRKEVWARLSPTTSSARRWRGPRWTWIAHHGGSASRPACKRFGRSANDCWGRPGRPRTTCTNGCSLSSAAMRWGTVPIGSSRVNASAGRSITRS
jgi:hypothetical protein